MLHKAITALFLFGLLFTTQPAKAATVAIDDLDAGDLIRGQTVSAVYYYGEDGFRYVFPNDKTYFTWYSDFSNIKWVSDEDLGKIQIGGNVTYKPGVKMIKINTDPKVYAIGEGGELWWVSTESAATALYGSNWNKMIDDVPDGFFSNYTKTSHEITGLDDFDPDTVESSASTISKDKDLSAYTLVEIDDNGFVNEEVTIDAGETIMFKNTGDERHSATSDDLDWGSGTLPSGSFWVRRFNEEGTYTYFCSYHPTESGTIIVK